MKCTIFNVQRFSTHDGEGIRTNIFFKGCPLRCKWCSNPESQSSKPELIYDDKLCRNFRDCIKNSNDAILCSENGIKVNRQLIYDINLYRTVCPAKALVVTGEERSVEEVLREIDKDLPFYNNRRGGVTFTGGEPFFQDEVLYRLAGQLKQKGIHIAIETCLHLPWKKLEKFTDLFDIFLVDIKHTDAEKFRKFTGGDLAIVLDNLTRLAASGANIVARVPVIPDFNFSDLDMKSIINYILSIKEIKEIHFIPYHSLGARKYLMLGREYELRDIIPVRSSDVEPWVDFTRGNGLKANIGG